MPMMDLMSAGHDSSCTQGAARGPSGQRRPLRQGNGWGSSGGFKLPVQHPGQLQASARVSTFGRGAQASIWSQASARGSRPTSSAATNG